MGTPAQGHPACSCGVQVKLSTGTFLQDHKVPGWATVSCTGPCWGWQWHRLDQGRQGMSEMGVTQRLRKPHQAQKVT